MPPEAGKPFNLLLVKSGIKGRDSDLWIGARGKLPPQQ